MRAKNELYMEGVVKMAERLALEEAEEKAAKEAA